METFLNKKYKLNRAENIDELLCELDVDIITRQITKTLSTTVELFRKGDEYTLITKILFVATTQKFKIGEEQNITTSDGRKVKNIFTIDGNVLKETQVGEKTCTIVREFFEEEMIATYYSGNVVSKGYFQILNQ